MSHLLSCPKCSDPLTVEVPQAGEILRCPKCGADVEVPTMREIRQLPPAEDAAPTQASTWNLARGWLFIAGAIAIGIAVLAHFQLNPQRQLLDTQKPAFEEIDFSIDRLSLEEAWKAWNHFRVEELDYRDTPEFLANRTKHKELSYFLYAAWTTGVLGLGLIAASIVWPTRR